MILTLSDYNTVGGSSRPWQVSAMQDALQRGPLILAGTSYRDPDIRRWVHELTEASPQSQIIVFLARQGLGLDRRQFENVQSALVRQWSALGVQVIATHDHADAAQAFRELPAMRRVGYLPPTVRARRLWATLLTDFTNLQLRHAEQLEADLEAMQLELSGVDNLPLWIADGSGELIRWASHDRLYRDPAALRRVDLGHDSPWIAGQCMGLDDQLARDIPPGGATSRWRSVVANPLVAELPGGPAFSCGVITAASTSPIEQESLDRLNDAHTNLTERWADRLTDISPSRPTQD